VFLQLVVIFLVASFSEVDTDEDGQLRSRRSGNAAVDMILLGAKYSLMGLLYGGFT